MKKARPLIRSGIEESDLANVREALLYEEKAIADYASGAQETNDPALREIFEHLGKDEQDHARTLRYYLEYGQAPQKVD